MQEKLIAMYIAAQTKIDYFIKKEKGAVDIVAIVILIAVAIGLAVFFKDQLRDLLERWFGSIGGAGDTAIQQGAGVGN